jgi:hemerythrin-like domain-containing protein
MEDPMSPAIQILMDEHRSIERMLDALETFALGLERLEPETQRSSLREFATFFRDYADGLHHAKEEDRLFVAMVDHGFPKDQGPIAVMLHEHVLGREHVGSLGAAGERNGALSAEECASVRHHAHAYAAMLRAHIQKEDQILYPLAERAIPRDAMARMDEEFEASTTAGRDGARASLQTLAERLLAAFPPGGSGRGGAHA